MIRYVLFLALFVPVMLWGASGFAQIVLGINSTINFGTYEFDTSHRVDIEMGKNGKIALANQTGIVYSGGASPGAVTISATPQDVVEVKCDRSGRIIVQENGQRLNINQLQISVDAGVPYGSGSSCDGVGGRRNPAAVIDLAANPDPVILIGGRLRVFRNRLVSGTHAASNTGGNDIRIRVIFQ